MAYGPKTKEGKQRISKAQRLRWARYNRAKQLLDWTIMAQTLGKSRVDGMKERNDLHQGNDRRGCKV